MRYEQNAVLDSLRRAQQFLDAHADALETVNPSARKQLERVAAQIADLSILQETGSRGARGETAKQRALLAALRRDHMAPIAVVAKLELRAMPEFVSLQMPQAGGSAERLLVAAYSMADAAARYSDVLIDNGLSATFADDLRDAAAAVSEAATGRNTYRLDRTGATAGLDAAQRRGRAILKILNALIARCIRNDAQLVAEWNAARKIGRKPGPPAGRQSVDASPIRVVEDQAAPRSAAASTVAA